MRLFGLNQLLALWVAAATVVATPSFAEDGPMTSTPDVALPELPAPQQQQQPQDRKDGAGAAAAMAAVGAAMAGMSCAMLLKQAQQEPDPSKAAMLRAQAMQQCAQAAQNAATAAQNNDSKDKLAATDDPKVELGYKPEVKDYRQTDSKATASASPSATSTESPTQIADANSDEAPPVQVFDQPDTNWDSGNLGSRAKGESISQLKPIENPALTFDEQSKGGGTTPGAVTGPTTTSGFAMGGFSNDALRQLASGTLDAMDGLKKTTARRSKSKLEVESHGDGAGGESGHGHSGSEGGGDVGSMLAKIMGGGAEEGALPGGAQLTDLSVAKAPASNRSPNIFQYASYRFRKSKREGDLKKGRVAMVGR